MGSVSPDKVRLGLRFNPPAQKTKFSWSGRSGLATGSGSELKMHGPTLYAIVITDGLLLGMFFFVAAFYFLV